MRTCLNLVTLKQGLDPIEGIKIAGAAGFEGVGLWADTLEAHGNALAAAAEVASALSDHGVRAEEMCYVAGWMWAEGEELRQALDVIRERAELAAAVGCPIIIACASGGTCSVRAAAEDFARICDIGAEVGVSFALEYIGMLEQVKDLKSGLEIVSRAEHPNGKLLIDTFHTFRGGSSVQEFDLPTGDQVGLVHINDAPPGDVLTMEDSDRVMPGDGAFPLREALGKLAARGFGGALSVEVFSRDWWNSPMDKTAAKALESLKSVMV